MLELHASFASLIIQIRGKLLFTCLLNTRVMRVLLSNVLLLTVCTRLKHGLHTDSIVNCKHNINMNRNTLGVLQHELIGNNDTAGDEIQNDPRHNNNFCDQMITAKFILSLEAAHKVSSTALDSIVSSTGSMMSEMLQKLSMRLLSIEGIEGFHENIQGVFSQSNEIQCFKDLQTHQCRRTFYREHFSLIPPEKCLLGSKYVKCWGGG